VTAFTATVALAVTDDGQLLFPAHDQPGLRQDQHTGVHTAEG
jgi:hypothetical protein